ncbi:hypothetical protein EJ04DRAFT_572689 [Polyplosphaeria fusca]|uniref:Uncharacterized protein n=1 Tax=Polyplosphaeria fusca TaxID=682080 RepID=A0A9P4V7V4_9PLEO|nr:hypothetical protein EJ04DRAFT_572689 [Polyplosphaeria fusca]
MQEAAASAHAEISSDRCTSLSESGNLSTAPPTHASKPLAQGVNMASNLEHVPQDTSRKNRKYFTQVQPSFFVQQPVVQLEFLDNSDPTKGRVVRKKAREWVALNKKKASTSGGRKREAPKRKDHAVQRTDSVVATRQGQSLSPTGRRVVTPLGPLRDISGQKFDPFDVLPNVGRKIDHIVEYFLTSCPEEVPCCDDRYAWRSLQPFKQPSPHNSVLRAMATERVSFILWLFATTLIRDGMTGNWWSQECVHFYTIGLQEMQKASTRSVTQYTDSFFCALACFTACSNFAGQWKPAELHRDAMVRALELKGDGSAMKGLMSCNSFTRKATVWCEFHVAAQQSAAPKLPYCPPPAADPLPEPIAASSRRLTSTTLSLVPNAPEPLPYIILQLHQLSLSAIPPAANGVHQLDHRLSRTLYDTEWTLLQVLDAQRSTPALFSPVQICLTEACQLYMWTAVRCLPPILRLCDLLITRLKASICTLLAQSRNSTPGSADDGAAEAGAQPGAYAYLITWSLFVGAAIASCGPRPEYGWFKEEFWVQMGMHEEGVGDREWLRGILGYFPITDALFGLGVASLGFP